MQPIAVDSVQQHEEQTKPLLSLPKIRYTPYTLRLIRRIRRVMFPGHRLDRMAQGAREALARCEQIGQCKID